MEKKLFPEDPVCLSKSPMEITIKETIIKRGGKKVMNETRLRGVKRVDNACQRVCAGVKNQKMEVSGSKNRIVEGRPTGTGRHSGWATSQPPGTTEGLMRLPTLGGTKSV